VTAQVTDPVASAHAGSSAPSGAAIDEMFTPMHALWRNRTDYERDDD